SLLALLSCFSLGSPGSTAKYARRFVESVCLPWPASCSTLLFETGGVPFSKSVRICQRLMATVSRSDGFGIIGLPSIIFRIAACLASWIRAACSAAFLARSSGVSSLLEPTRPRNGITFSSIGLLLTEIVEPVGRDGVTGGDGQAGRRRNESGRTR